MTIPLSLLWLQGRLGNVVLILSSHRHNWALVITREEERNGCWGGSFLPIDKAIPVLGNFPTYEWHMCAKTLTGYPSFLFPGIFLTLLCLPVSWDLTSMDYTTWTSWSSGFYLYSADVPTGNKRAWGETSQDIYSDGCSFGSGWISQSMATTAVGCPLFTTVGSLACTNTAPSPCLFVHMGHEAFSLLLIPEYLIIYC